MNGGYNFKGHVPQIRNYSGHMLQMNKQDQKCLLNPYQNNGYDRKKTIGLIDKTVQWPVYNSWTTAPV